MTFSESGSFLSDEFVIKMGKQIKNITKQTVEIRPSNSQTVYKNDQRILFQIPYSSTFSLKDIALHFDGEATSALSGTPSGGSAGVQLSSLFPKNMNIFSDIIVRINGKIVSSFANRYNDVYSILTTFEAENDPSKTILQNGKPESKHYLNGDTVESITGLTTTIANADSLVDKSQYVITQFCGLLGNNTSASFLDTRILGECTIEFVLAPASVLMFGSGKTLTERAGLGGTTATIGYELKNVKLSMQRYNLDSSYYEGIDRNLSSGSTYKIAFDHYDIFSKSAVADTDSLMFNINAHDIKNMYGFFTNADRGAEQRPKLDHLAEANGFFDSYWYEHKGTTFATGQWQIGSTLVPQNPMGATECMLELIRMHNQKQNSSDTRLSTLYSVPQFKRNYFVCPISFEFSEDKTDTRIISGLSTEGLPLAISWNYKLTAPPSAGKVNANVMVATTRILTINNGSVVDVEL